MDLLKVNTMSSSFLSIWESLPLGIWPKRNKIDFTEQTVVTKILVKRVKPIELDQDISRVIMNKSAKRNRPLLSQLLFASVLKCEPIQLRKTCSSCRLIFTS